MEPDQLQWLWDGVDEFRKKFNDLRERPFDVAKHDVNCGLKNSQTRIPCSCCKGALTSQEAKLVKEKLTGGRAMPKLKD